MAKKQSSNSKKKYDSDWDDISNNDKTLKPTKKLQKETVGVIYAVAFFVASLFLIFSAADKAGPVGEKIYSLLSFLLGIGYFLLPLILLVLGILFFKSIKRQMLAWPKLVGSLLFLFSSLGIISVIFKDSEEAGRGGFIGNLIASPLVGLFEFWVTLIILFGLLIISTVVVFETSLLFSSLAFWKKENDDDLSQDEIAVPEVAEKSFEAEKIPQPSAEEMDADTGKKFAKDIGRKRGGMDAQVSRLFGKPFTPPPLSLLEEDRGKPGVGDIKANANIIKRTLQNFGINVEMDEISIGPSVTRYALKPAEGVKLARIVGLQNDLSLALAAHPLRIEAPIPGKSLVGIEIPNSTKTTVGLGTLLASADFQESDKPLLFSLGKGISGKSHFANLGKMPHLLIAGATGSGKSVTIHTILTSLLYRNSPENLKFIMIDPKRVELTLYNNIPHLLTPVITDAKKAILALKWAAKEMDRRYDILETEKVRDVDSYHKTVLAPAMKNFEARRKDDPEIASEIPETMPYIVIVIDEMADLMQAYPRELESAIVRLAQMSRAVGIHLMVSTQRPSVNIITGLIKANIPSRIALQVTSQIDSRTILDTGGAEKLLGAGDMLFLSGEMSKPARIQSAYISESEVKNVVKYLVDNYADEVPSDINLTETALADKNAIFESTFGDGDDDDLYEEAREIIVSAGKASTSYLQRKLRIGYARAARLIDMLEERGVIGAGDGAKAREVIGGSAGESSADNEFGEPDA